MYSVFRSHFGNILSSVGATALLGQSETVRHTQTLFTYWRRPWWFHLVQQLFSKVFSQLAKLGNDSGHFGSHHLAYIYRDVAKYPQIYRQPRTTVFPSIKHPQCWTCYNYAAFWSLSLQSLLTSRLTSWLKICVFTYWIFS